MIRTTGPSDLRVRRGAVGRDRASNRTDGRGRFGRSRTLTRPLLLVAVLAAALVGSLSGARPVAAESVNPWEAGEVKGSGDGGSGVLRIPPEAQSGVKAIAAGGHHSLALKEDGTVVAWGATLSRENEGQADVPAGLTGVKAIAAGGFHSLALKEDGTVVAWGKNLFGQSTVPVGLSGVTAIAASTDNSMALLADGTIVAWGTNAQSQVPAGLSGVTAIASGGDNSVNLNSGGHHLALKSDGTVVAWGGINPPPAGLSGVKAIAAGAFHDLAVKQDGTVVAWGKDTQGQTLVPAGLTGVKAVAAGMQHSVALKEDGSVVIWGQYNYGYTWLPPGLGRVGAISGGGDHTLFLEDTTAPAPAGFLAADPGVGQVSLTWANPLTPDFTKVRILRSPTGAATGPVPTGDQTQIYEGTAESYVDAGLTDVAQYYTIFTRDIAGNFSLRTVATTVDDGTVVTWGDNTDGQRNVPAEALSGVQDVAAGQMHSLALREDGTVIAWGKDLYGQSTIPAGLTGVKAIAAGGAHSLALTEGGTVVGWGANFNGQTTIPAGLTGVKAISAGAAHSLALKEDGTVVAWGETSSGQSTVPAGLTGVKAISAGGYHSLALKEDGTVVAWGQNYNGQSTVPAGLTGVKAVAAGSNHSLALKDDGTLVAWGDSYGGAVDIPAGLGGVKVVAAGGYQSLALKEDGTVVAWGEDASGQSTVPTGLRGVQAIAAGGFHSLALTGNTRPPADVGGFTADPGDRQVSLSWVNPSTFDFEAVRILRSTTGAATGPVPNADQAQIYEGTAQFLTDTGPLDTGLINGTTYHYTIYAIDRVDNASPGVTATVAPGAEWNGTVVAWGENSSGQGNVPGGLNGVTAIAAGGEHNLALKQDGTVVGWGLNTYGQGSSPAGLDGVTAIAAGYSHSVALRDDGTVLAWGSNIYGEGSAPADLVGVKAIGSGFNHSLAVKEDGTVVAWGANGQGQSNVPVDLTGVKAVAGGIDHSIALREDGTVAAWGRSGLDQSSVPVGLNGVTSIAAGGYRSLALREDGTVVAWGFAATVPAGLTGVKAIASGQFHDLALKEDGTVVAWDSSGPVAVPAGLRGVTAISGGRYHSTALLGNAAPPRNRPPTADAQTVAANAPTIVTPITLTGSDPDDDVLTYAIVTPPSKGALSCAGASCTYSARAGVTGIDSFEASVTDPAGASSSATISLRLDSTTPGVFLGQANKLEPESGPSARGMMIPLTLSQPSPVPLTVRYATSDGTARRGLDYIRWGTDSAPRSITIPAGVTHTLIAPPVLDDATLEGDETFTVRLLSVTGGPAYLGSTSAEVTIRDADGVTRADPSLPVLSITSISQFEGNASPAKGRKAQLRVELSKPLTTTLKMRWTTVAGTAVAGADYTPRSNLVLTFLPGQMELSIDLSVIADDLPEGDESFSVLLSSITGGDVTVANNFGTVTMLDED